MLFGSTLSALAYSALASAGRLASTSTRARSHRTSELPGSKRKRVGILRQRGREFALPIEQSRPDGGAPVDTRSQEPSLPDRRVLASANRPVDSSAVATLKAVDGWSGFSRRAA